MGKSNEPWYLVYLRWSLSRPCFVLCGDSQQYRRLLLRKAFTTWLAEILCRRPENRRLNRKHTRHGKHTRHRKHTRHGSHLSTKGRPNWIHTRSRRPLLVHIM